MIAPKLALMGIVMNHAVIILLRVIICMDAEFCTSSTPTIEPTRIWEVDIGKPRREESKIVMAVTSSAQKPLLGSMLAILSLFVIILRTPVL